VTQLNSDTCYIFTDTETTGLDINFSQIIQVGSLLTDEDLVVEKEHNLFSKLLPWVVPSPEAFLIHKKIECLNEESPSHYEMMLKLREDWLSWSSDIFPMLKYLDSGCEKYQPHTDAGGSIAKFDVS